MQFVILFKTAHVFVILTSCFAYSTAVFVVFTCSFRGLRISLFLRSVYAIVNEALLILVRLFVISGLVVTFICTQNLNKDPFEVAAGVLA